MSWTASEVMTRARVQQYGEFSGDNNAIHTDPDAAAAAGLPAPVAHGILTVGIVLAHAAEWLGEIGARIEGYETRFTAPVYVYDDPVRLEITADVASDGRLDVSVVAIHDGVSKAVLRPMRVYFAS